MISILISVYNEDAYIYRCLETVMKEDIGHWEKEILVVNDGSTDHTSQELENFIKQESSNVKIFTESKNRGKGAAIKKMAAHATGDILIIQDADLEYDPRDFVPILKKYREEKVEVVYGSRILGAKYFTNFSSHPLFYLGGRILSGLVNLTFGTKLTDQPTCYKSWRKELTPGILKYCSSNRFDFEIELTAFFVRFNHAIHEVPIRYYPRAISSGKKIGPKDFVMSLYSIIRSYRKIRS